MNFAGVTLKIENGWLTFFLSFVLAPILSILRTDEMKQFQCLN